MVIKLDKESIIDKIATSVGINDTEVNSSVKSKNAALRVASEMLKVAATKQRELEIKVAQLSLEVDNFNRDRDNLNKQKLAKEIASGMFEKGLIKKSDISVKSEELEGMETIALEMLGNTIQSIPEKIANDNVSDLTFLYGDNNIKEKKTMVNAINDFMS